MSGPVTEPGWYRAGPQGLMRVAGLDEEPEGEPWELVRVDVDPQAATEEPLF